MLKTTEPADFGTLLRQWRQARRMTQEQLADDAEISTRHLSFLEGGRSRPSREMVLVLGSALDLPLRDRNQLLGAAGFAPVYRDSPLDGPALASVMRAVDHILNHQEPFGAILMDRAWNLIKANRGAQRILALFPPRSAVAASNLLLTLCHPDGIRPHVVNWEPLVSLLIDRHRREVAAFPNDAARRDVLDAMLAQPGVAELPLRPEATLGHAPYVTVHLRNGAVEARLFTLLTSLGTPLDVTAEELRIESYFPADDATEALLRGLARD